ncbi:hypothetical protein WJX75_000125 [Coccomyxa subellipsoidea]|uniref:Anaphase-promoting complex subunit 13 n=1 Tax=Coccomyxa subellipsoidea TaxID=248742 RepID=A0ABR2YQQ9_9CHLO
MSTTIHFSLISEPHLLDIIDDEWMQDTLADDDIPLPEGMQAPNEEADDLQEDQSERRKGPEKWGDLGLQSVH